MNDSVVSYREICDNVKMAREAAILGSYDSSTAYYQGVILQISRLISCSTDPVKRSKWTEVSRSWKMQYVKIPIIDTSRLNKGS